MINRIKSITDVLNAHQELRDQRDNAVRPHYSIAVSRECYALGGEICRKLSAKLGWNLYDKEIIEAVAHDMVVGDKLIEGLEGDRHHWLREAFAQIAGAPNQTAFAIHLKKILLAIAARGNAIFLGRGAGYILPKHHCFRVHVVADKDLRIRRCMDRLGLDRAKAAKWIVDTDEGRKAFIRDFFFQNVGDPRCVDVVFNTTDLSTDACANSIAELAKDRWPDLPRWPAPHLNVAVTL